MWGAVPMIVDELEVMAPLFIYGPDGGYSTEMTDIFKELSSLP